jgi:hypothetical protein
VSLQVAVPNAEERELVMGVAPEDVPLLGKAEEFMRAVQDVPRLEQRLKCWAFKRRFDSAVAEIKPQIETLLKAAEQLLTSQELVDLLKMTLAVGNYMNGGTSRANAYGFKMESLGKLADTKSADNKLTLLDFIAQQCALNAPSALQLSTALSAVPEARRLIVTNIATEIAELDKGLKLLSAELENAEYKRLPEDKFASGLQDFASRAQSEVDALQAANKELLDKIAAMASYFAEDPKQLVPEQFFTSITEFLGVWDKSVQKIDQNKVKDGQKQREVKAAEEKQQKEREEKEAEAAKAAAKKDDEETGLVDNLMGSLVSGAGFRRNKHRQMASVVSAIDLQAIQLKKVSG